MKIKSFLILLVISTQAFSQSNKFEIGLNLGAGLSELRGANSQENSIQGASMGLLFQYNVTDLFSIHSNILYETKGTELPNSEWQCPNCPKNADLILEYITVPVLARLNFGSKTKFFINAGPYFGYLMNYEWVDNRFDYGLATGLGGQIDLSENLILSLELRNSFGLTPFTENTLGFENDRYTNTLNLLVGIAYRFENKKLEE